MKKKYKFAFISTKNFSGGGGRLPSSLKRNEIKIIGYQSLINCSNKEEQDFSKKHLPSSNFCKVMSGRSQKCKAISGLNQIFCKVFLGRDIWVMHGYCVDNVWILQESLVNHMRALHASSDYCTILLSAETAVSLKVSHSFVPFIFNYV